MKVSTAFSKLYVSLLLQLVESLLSKLVDEVENRFSSLELVCRFNNLVPLCGFTFCLFLYNFTLQTKANSKDVVAASSQGNKLHLKSAFSAKRVCVNPFNSHSLPLQYCQLL